MPASRLSQVFDGRAHDLGGGLGVRRILPAAGCRQVGPYVFVDHMGPARFEAGGGIDVRPHPHIGLATVTYLYEGELLHRDSLGVVQAIRPGELNWMTAGAGIVHSERTADARRAAPHAIHGMQCWVALPREAEAAAPDFQHLPADAMPAWTREGARAVLIAGTWGDRRSPARAASALFQIDLVLPPATRFRFEALHAERAIYVVMGAVRVDTEGLLTTGQLGLVAAGETVTLEGGAAGARLMLLGGAPLDGERFVWWNFVASDRAAIDAAAERWQAGGFAPVPGETEFIPLPTRAGR